MDRGFRGGVVIFFFPEVPFFLPPAGQGLLGTAAAGEVTEEKEQGQGEPDPGAAEDEGCPGVTKPDFLPPTGFSLEQAG